MCARSIRSAGCSAVIALALLSCVSGSAASSPDPAAPPNIVLIVADDMGYADLGCQGATTFRTPPLDRLAVEGTRFTGFYVAQAVCTASRAALMSGCYPNRVGLQGALNHTSRNGIHPDEWLLPEMLRARGYATCGAGKWHLGTRARFSRPARAAHRTQIRMQNPELRRDLHDDTAAARLDPQERRRPGAA